MLTPSWYAWARGELGQREIVGDQDNPRIVEYWKLGKVALEVNNDETPWCAAFVAAALESSGYRSTRDGRARSYEKHSSFATLPQTDLPPIPTWPLGAIVVLSSPAGPANGHVGFLESVTATHVRLLGGNQGNAVSVAPFPRARILRVCWPVAAPAASKYPLAPVVGAAGQAVSDR